MGKEHPASVDTSLANYDYELPEERIAQVPPHVRGDSRLCVLRREKGNELTKFRQLAAYLPENALLVANNTKVAPARLLGHDLKGRAAEFLLLTPLPLLQPQGEGNKRCAQAHGLLKNSKRFRPGETLFFEEGITFAIESKGEFGRVQGTLAWEGELAKRLEKAGAPPLPPYIKRGADKEDVTRYQTVYASPLEPGSVAAPTAGLHFDAAHVQELRGAGFGWAEVTLYVGYGTFSPIRCENIAQHRMHAEYVRVPEAASRAICEAREQGRPIVAVGTTVVRTLEGVAALRGGLEPFAGWVDLFIRPGFRFQVVDHLLTNFHLPRSSLLVLVSALAGRERILRTYEEALAAGFRFFSYGDAMLIL